MTEPEAPAVAAPEAPEARPAEPAANAGAPSPRPRRSTAPWVSFLGFLALAAGLVFVWLNPRTPARPPDTAALAALGSRLDQLAGQLAAAQKELAALPPPPDLGPIEARLSALEKRPPPAPIPSNAAELGTALAPLAGRIDRLETSLAGIRTHLARAEHMARLAGTAVALEQGRPLGHLPGAPPALARFATTAPPTLAGLRLSFADAARAESKAARPSGAGQPLMKQMLQRLGDLFTLSEGNRVIIGNPAAPALARARAALDAGDLAAALAALASLPRPLAPAMAAWEDQAKALLAANAAMAAFAGSG